ncbi:DNA polymerase, partial [Thalassiosira pseudonana CCMP1335]
SGIKIEKVSSEEGLLRRIASIVHNLDPDVLISWDTQGSGIGYLVERGVALGKPIDDSNGAGSLSSKCKIDMSRLLGRTPKASSDEDKSGGSGAFELGVEVDWARTGAAAASIVGRIVVCGWKICSEECKHPNASYQPAIVSTVLNKRIPFHDELLLTRWYSGDNGVQRWRVIEHKLACAISNVLLLDALDVLGRAGEGARLSGVEFSQSLPGIRGSQYKVEGVLLRALQSNMGYFFYSPSKADCSNQEALECQAMTLEPKSGFHFDPVVVCDFTALYPSLVIAYNLCYSTVAGKLDYHKRRTAAVLKHHMKSVPVRTKRDRAYAIPTGSVFVSESVLKGVLPQVLDEMLSTRAMLKKAAKEYKKRVPNLSPAVLRQIEARQLALKYVANVTYGYTSATFSGRSAVPLVADAIVECGRRTLTNAINVANTWGKEASGSIYGDTDSVFIKLPGRSVKEAFTFGEEYVKAVTASNPPPVQIKLEKVYAACLMQTKKKYCGMVHESTSQKRPVFEAKGIETVRRDQCSLTQKILRNALICSFQHGLGRTKEYLRTQWSLVHASRVPVSDFVLTGRVRSRYRGGKIGPVQAALARRLAEVDPGRVVRHKERLPYVIVASPGQSFKLRDCVLTPLELLEQWDAYTIHSAYYITKHVNAALQRCFGLAPFKINIHSWYDACPKPRKRIHYWPLSKVGSSSMISTYFGSDLCSLCGMKCKSTGSSRVAICGKCKEDSVNVSCIVIERLNKTQQQASRIAGICAACNG